MYENLRAHEQREWKLQRNPLLRKLRATDLIRELSLARNVRAGNGPGAARMTLVKRALVNLSGASLARSTASPDEHASGFRERGCDRSPVPPSLRKRAWEPEQDDVILRIEDAVLRMAH